MSDVSPRLPHPNRMVIGDKVRGSPAAGSGREQLGGPAGYRALIRSNPPAKAWFIA
jgi:hypothetical protein